MPPLRSVDLPAAPRLSRFELPSSPKTGRSGGLACSSATLSAADPAPIPTREVRVAHGGSGRASLFLSIVPGPHLVTPITGGPWWRGASSGARLSGTFRLLCHRSSTSQDSGSRKCRRARKSGPRPCGISSRTPPGSRRRAMSGICSIRSGAVRRPTADPQRAVRSAAAVAGRVLPRRPAVWWPSRGRRSRTRTTASPRSVGSSRT
jgi:hypothetical protein